MMKRAMLSPHFGGVILLLEVSFHDILEQSKDMQPSTYKCWKLYARFASILRAILKKYSN
jgi:hypothetical protein